MWTGNSGYLRLLCNYVLCKSIVIFHFIDKTVFLMPLKAVVLTTHTVSMDESELLPTDQKIKFLVSQLKT